MLRAGSGQEPPGHCATARTAARKGMNMGGILVKGKRIEPQRHREHREDNKKRIGIGMQSDRVSMLFAFFPSEFFSVLSVSLWFV
jgi:hypothetical protein